MSSLAGSRRGGGVGRQPAAALRVAAIRYRLVTKIGVIVE